MQFSLKNTVKPKRGDVLLIDNQLYLICRISGVYHAVNLNTGILFDKWTFEIDALIEELRTYKGEIQRVIKNRNIKIVEV